MHRRLELDGQPGVPFFETQSFLIKCPPEPVDDHGYDDRMVVIDQMRGAFAYRGVRFGGALRKAHYPAMLQTHPDAVLGGCVELAFYVLPIGPPGPFNGNSTSHTEHFG